MADNINSIELSVSCENRDYVSIGLEDTVYIDLNPLSNPEIDIDETNIGKDGKAATIAVGTVTTLQPNQNAYVENVGTSTAAIFNFGIPKGDSGSGENADFSNITGSPYDCDALATALNGKQDVIEDLSDIRSGAEAGATAVQPSSLATVATSGSYTDLINQPTIPTKTSDLNNDSGFITSSALSGYATETWVGQQGYITGITSSMVTTALGFTPYNSSNPSGYQANVIETVKVNGSALTPSSKAVDVTVPTENTVSGWGFTKNAGTVTSVNNVSPTNGNVSLTIPTVDQTYDSTSTNAQSGVAVASAVSGKQDVSNLVTSVSSSSTDNQYPSALCLYTLLGDVESLINAL